MPGFVPTFCIFIASASFLLARSYDVDGIVVAVDAQRRNITVTHRPIPGYMPAMTMDFSAGDLTGIQPGTRVRFRFDPKDKVVRSLKRLPVDESDMPRPAREPAVGGPAPLFQLTDQRNRSVSLDAFKGELVLVNFIYTRCPMSDVCPRLSASFATVQRRFGAKVKLLSITVDPAWDTPEVLDAYAKLWRAGGENWRFLTGSPAHVAAVAVDYGLVYWPEEGSIAHTSRTFLIGRDGKLLAAVEGTSFRADQLVRLVEYHLEAR
jgi:protein SCO1/2